MKAEKTLAILIMLLPFLYGCRENERSEKETGRFVLVRPSHDAYGNPCQQIRFNVAREKDDRALALEKVKDDWNRNLIMGSCPCPDE